MSSTGGDRALKEKQENASKQGPQTKTVRDLIQRQSGKSASPNADKAAFVERPLSSTPISSRQRRTGPTATHLSATRRRTETYVIAATTELTPPPSDTRRSATEFRTPDCFTAVAFETPGAQLRSKKTAGDVAVSHDDLESLSSSVIVAVRLQPYMTRSVACLFIQIVDGVVKS